MNRLSPKHLTAFDAVIEGDVYATMTPNGVVNLYYTGRPDQSDLLGTFPNESVFGSLIGGWPTVEDFNSAMTKRRKKTLTFVPKEAVNA